MGQFLAKHKFLGRNTSLPVVCEEAVDFSFYVSCLSEHCSTVAMPWQSNIKCKSVEENPNKYQPCVSVGQFVEGF